MPDRQILHAKKQDNNLKPKLAAKNPDENFIPFICHFDPNTILTKNGELLQVVRITGFNHESVGSELVNLRETVRDAIAKNIKTSNFAMWLHTIRRRKNIAPGGTYEDYFSNKLNEDWNLQNDWKNQFVNELYLTIIIQGYDTSITNGVSLFQSLSIKGTKNLHVKKLEAAHKTLSQTVKNIVEDLNHYGARLIGLMEWEGTLYSEPMRVFGKIINLCEDRFPLRANDMASELSSYKVAFGNQSLEVAKGDYKCFGAMFSIKEYREVSIASLDKFLQIPQEFIITQSLDFISNNAALAHFEYQNYILEISGDEELLYLSDLEKTIESATVGTTNYANQQMTIMLINSTVQGLESDIDNALERLHNLGLVSVREDILSEHCFWSQLPGNFQFLKRQKPIAISRIAGFASLHNFPAGSRDGNHWGRAVSIFRTVLGTPYFFNFHKGNNGHTMIAGPLGSGKTVLLNFLVSQSRKFKNKLYYFGHQRSGNIFINAIGGDYLSLNPNLEDKDSLKMNPLFLADNPENRAFLSNWFGALVNYGKEPISKEELNLIPKIVGEIVSSKTKKLSEAAKFFKTENTKNIYRKLSIWHGGGKYAYIFDHEQESDLSINLINAFNITPVASYKTIVVAIASYLLHKIETMLDGNKTIIVLDEAWKLLDNYITGPKINNWLTRLREKNCAVIFATESVKDAAQSSITEAINHNIATQIFLPDPEPTEYYKTVFGLNDNEYELLTVMSHEEHHFLLKHRSDSVVSTLDLSDMEDSLMVLSAKTDTLLAMEKAMEKYGKNPRDWLPAFLQIAKKQRDSGS
ncbi:MAG: virB4 2 [Rickettsiaceae bacterium]|jgi:type IV secretion system protein VirB4|nr:virB4 2 [Rickettsiaceae bacterium]